MNDILSLANELRRVCARKRGADTGRKWRVRPASAAAADGPQRPWDVLRRGDRRARWRRERFEARQGAEDARQPQHRAVMLWQLASDPHPDPKEWREFDIAGDPPLMTMAGSCVAFCRLLVALMFAAGPEAVEGPALVEEFFDYHTGLTMTG